MRTIKFACYSDIHHHEYANGIAGDDVVAVEKEFLELCLKEKVDFWVFGGDRFLSRNPLDVSRRNADLALKEKAESGIPGIILIGNHDRWTKSPHSGHNLYNISIYQNDLPNISVLERSGQLTMRIKDSVVQFHAIPAGHKPHDIKLNMSNSADFRICLFHDILRGCRFTNGIVAPEGLEPSVLDLKEFDIVLGGDNHQPQDLNFRNTIGRYIGAPMQHNWGDVGSERGYLLVTLTVDADGNRSCYTNFIHSSAPKFIQQEWQVDDVALISNMASGVSPWWGNNIVRLTIKGKSSVLAGLNPTALSDKLRTITRARSVRTVLNIESEEQQFVPYAKTITPADEWNEYLVYKRKDFDGLDINRVKALGLKYIIEGDNS